MLRAVLIATIMLLATFVYAKDLPYLPPPSGFVESSTLVPVLKDQALLGHPAGTRLIGVYLLPDELSAIMHGGEERMSIFCRAYVIHESATEDDAKAYFRSLVTNAKQEGSKPFSLDDPDNKRIIQNYTDATKRKRGQSVGLTGATILGSIVDTDEAYGKLMVVAGKAQTDQGEIAIPMAAAVAWVRGGNQILEISDLAQFSGQDSIALANEVVTNWVKALARPKPKGNFFDQVDPRSPSYVKPEGPSSALGAKAASHNPFDQFDPKSPSYVKPEGPSSALGALPEAQRLAFEHTLAKFRKAAEQGELKAQLLLGFMYSEGRGVLQDYVEAAKWYRKAAEQGDAQSQYNLGVMYSEGEGVPQDDLEAVKWYRKGAEQGDAQSQGNLGFMYREGRGVLRDYDEAAKWYRKAAEQGDAESQENLGFMYRAGKGVPHDDLEAVKWFRKAAEQGDARSQYHLGVLYFLGEGVLRDYVAAYVWLSLAAAQGNDKARAALDDTENVLTPDERAQAQKLAREWKPKTAQSPDSPLK